MQQGITKTCAKSQEVASSLGSARAGSSPAVCGFFFASARGLLADHKECTPGGTRTHNLWLRKPTPYPLGYRGSAGYRGVSGLVVEWLPATESARVRFPAHAFGVNHLLPLFLSPASERAQTLTVAAWLNGRALDLGSNGCRFESCRERRLHGASWCSGSTSDSKSDNGGSIPSEVTFC